jgi:MFS family permease
MPTATVEPNARIRRARVATFVGFAALGGLMYTWSTSVTAFREQLGLSGGAGDFRFGLIVLSAGIAAALGSLAVGFFADRFGPRAPIAVCATLYPLALIGLGQVTAVGFAIPLGVLLGLFRGAMDTTLNTHGIHVERYYGRSIMSSFHACYSLGGFALGMAGSWMAGKYPNSATIQFSVLGTTLLIFGVLATLWMLPKDEILPATVELENTGRSPIAGRSPDAGCNPDAGPSPTAGCNPARDAGRSPPASAAVVWLVIAFGVLLLGSMIAENVVGDWGQEYLHRVDHATVSVAGIAVSIFIGTEALGRVFVDRLAQRYGRPALVLGSGLLAISGLVLSIAVNAPVASLIGFGALGLAMSSIAPLMFSSAGRADAANAGRNIGIMNSIGYSAGLVSPAVITLVVLHFGLQRLLLFPLVMMLPLAFFGPALMKTAERRGARSSLGLPTTDVISKMGAT